MWLVISTSIETEVLIKITGSHVHCECGNIWKRWKKEMSLLQTTKCKWHV